MGKFLNSLQRNRVVNVFRYYSSLITEKGFVKEFLIPFVFAALFSFVFSVDKTVLLSFVYLKISLLIFIGILACIFIVSKNTIINNAIDKNEGLKDFKKMVFMLLYISLFSILTMIIDLFEFMVPVKSYLFSYKVLLVFSIFYMIIITLKAFLLYIYKYINIDIDSIVKKENKDNDNN